MLHNDSAQGQRPGHYLFLVFKDSKINVQLNILPLVNVSLVLYRTPADELTAILLTLLRSNVVRRIYVIDNSPEPLTALPWEKGGAVFAQLGETPYRRIEYRHTGSNMGYGAAHNIAMRETLYDDVPYHLVLNTDIRFEPDVLSRLVAQMEQQPEIGLLQPRVTDEQGKMQYLCKMLPTPCDLLRRVVYGKHISHSRANNRFELHHLNHSRPINAPYLSGCFMLIRTAALEKAGLFDERFFMYPEDIDLTRRIHRDYLTLYYPSETIIHAHRRASYHSPKMFLIHAANICRYFNKWGWLNDPERRLYNSMLAK